VGLPACQVGGQHAQRPERRGRKQRDIFGAAEAGDLERVKALLKDTPELAHAADNQGTTPLHFAARNGRLEILAFLLSYRGEVDAKDNEGWTPLHWAAREGHEAVAKCLVDCGAGIQTPGPGGFMPLHVAVFEGSTNVAKMLLKEGADLRATVRDCDLEWNIGNYAAYCYNNFVRDSAALHLASHRGHTDVVALLLKHRAPVAVKDRKGWEPLHMAADGGHVDVLRLLVDHGAKVSTRTGDYQQEPLHLSARIGHADAVKFLLSSGANVDARSGRGSNYTPLHYAANYGKIDATRELLAGGADTKATGYQEKTPLQLADESGHSEVAELLLTPASSGIGESP
jgi:ankyrin repeat protein